MPVLVAVELDQRAKGREEGQREEQVHHGQAPGDDVVDPGEDVGHGYRQPRDDLGVDQTSLRVDRRVVVVGKVPRVDTQNDLSRKVQSHCVSLLQPFCGGMFHHLFSLETCLSRPLGVLASTRTVGRKAHPGV